ncbi:MAG: toll/interleukin-1 receptor domain-containing protein [Bacteroidales bacterium]|jgi:hypothetical protein|nr:toll/interleukin-1 receptor domain-containing protein [Bacteroidales bacterium]MCI2121847.1 toll/interleukin-1 receptor domain-containing protein [Bacteroidales bacterium]MCI2146031.1 toll/interleukin-1 receptor domain-containing protein [Bacteroidales bacterium]
MVFQQDRIIATEIPTNPEKKKTIFISYCHEDDSHKRWVKKLSKDLSSFFTVNIDENLPAGGDINKFMGSEILKADKVLIIATPKYKEKADNMEKGVGYETSIITEDLISDQNRIKFIPIIRKGSIEESLPIYLKSKKAVFMRESDNYNDALNDLITDLKNY